MEKKIYVARYESEALDNNERYFDAQVYNCIGDAIVDAQETIEAQQSERPGFAGTEIHAHGTHGVCVKPKYEGTIWNANENRFDNSTREGDWRWVIIELQEIK